MPPSELRKEAREALAGNWKKGVYIALAYGLIAFILSIVKNIFKDVSIPNMFMNIIVFIITVPISFGMISSFIKLKRSEKVSAFDFLEDGFKNFSKAWKIELWTSLKLLIPIICLIFVIILLTVVFSAIVITKTKFSYILGIIITILFIACIVYIVIRSLLYALSQYIAIDNPEMTAKDCVLKSQEIMTGNRGNLFLLELSFIGWAILSVLSLGIGSLWLFPYMQVAFVCFYDHLKNK